MAILSGPVEMNASGVTVAMAGLDQRGSSHAADTAAHGALWARGYRVAVDPALHGNSICADVSNSPKLEVVRNV